MSSTEHKAAKLGRLAERFGNGPVARQAINQTLSSKQDPGPPPVDADYLSLFEHKKPLANAPTDDTAWSLGTSAELSTRSSYDHKHRARAVSSSVAASVNAHSGEWAGTFARHGAPLQQSASRSIVNGSTQHAQVVGERSDASAELYRGDSMDDACSELGVTLSEASNRATSPAAQAAATAAVAGGGAADDRSGNSQAAVTHIRTSAFSSHRPLQEAASAPLQPGTPQRLETAATASSAPVASSRLASRRPASALHLNRTADARDTRGTETRPGSARAAHRAPAAAAAPAAEAVATTAAAARGRRMPAIGGEAAAADTARQATMRAAEADADEAWHLASELNGIGGRAKQSAVHQQTRAPMRPASARPAAERGVAPNQITRGVAGHRLISGASAVASDPEPSRRARPRSAAAPQRDGGRGQLAGAASASANVSLNPWLAQAPSRGLLATGPGSVRSKVFSFEPAHPALAEAHYLRTFEQNDLVTLDRLRKEEVQSPKQPRLRVGQVRSPSASPGRQPQGHRSRGSSPRAAQGMGRDGSARRDAGHAPGSAADLAAVERLERAETRSRDVERRAWEVIRASTNLSARQRAAGPSQVANIGGAGGGSGWAVADAAANSSANSWAEIRAASSPTRDPGYVARLEAQMQQLARSVEALATGRQLLPEEPRPLSKQRQTAPQSEDDDDVTEVIAMVNGGDDSGHADVVGASGRGLRSTAARRGHTGAPRAQQPAARSCDSYSDGSGSDSDGGAPVNGHSDAEEEDPAAAAAAARERELAVATGAFNAQRYQDYNAAVDEEMTWRATRGQELGGDEFAAGYESDLEREQEEAAAAEREFALQDLEAAEATRRQNELDRAAEVQAAWEEQNEWMDNYRSPEARRTGAQQDSSRRAAVEHQRQAQQQHDRHRHEEQEEYLQQHPAASNADADTDGAKADGGYEDWSDDGADGADEGRRNGVADRRVQLLEADEELLHQRFIPVVSDELHYYLGSDTEAAAQRKRAARAASPGGYHSDGPCGLSRHGGATGRPFTPTSPEPFTFEERAKLRPKSIMKVKLEQDLQLKAQEERAARAQRFQANPVPASTTQPLFQQIVEEQQIKRQVNHEQRDALLRIIEQPFSFYFRDQERLQSLEQQRQAARDPGRFQRAFRANPVPDHIKEERFKTMMLQLEAKRVTSRVRADLARERAKQRIEEKALARQAQAAEQYRQRLAASGGAGGNSSTGAAGSDSSPDPRQRQSHVRIPCFDKLHAEWERQQAMIKAASRRRVTVPQEFKLNGSTAEEQAAREAQARKRRRKIVMDIARDATVLPETRWPFMSPRAPVHPTAPPAFDVEPDLRVVNTLANRLRGREMAEAKRRGTYDTREERETREHEKARQEVQRRAKAYVKQQQEQLRQRMQSSTPTMQQHTGDRGTEHAAAIPSDAGCSAGAARTPNAPADVAQRREPLKERVDTPLMHIEARHQQVERQVHDMVGDVLLQQGLEAYKFVNAPE